MSYGRYNNKPAAVWTKHNDKIEFSDGGAVRITVGVTRNGQEVKTMVPARFLGDLVEVVKSLTEADIEKLGDGIVKQKELAKINEQVAKHQEKAQKLLQASIDALKLTGMDDDTARQTLGLAPKAA